MPGATIKHCKDETKQWNGRHALQRYCLRLTALQVGVDVVHIKLDPPVSVLTRSVVFIGDGKGCLVSRPKHNKDLKVFIANQIYFFPCTSSPELHTVLSMFVLNRKTKNKKQRKTNILEKHCLSFVFTRF